MPNCLPKGGPICGLSRNVKSGLLPDTGHRPVFILDIPGEGERGLVVVFGLITLIQNDAEHVDMFISRLDILFCEAPV